MSVKSTKPRAMTDQQLADRAREYKAHKLVEKAAKAKAEAVRDLLVPELLRRGRDQVEVHGVRVTRKVKRTKHLSPALVRARFGRKAIVGSLLREVVDSDGLAAALKAGHINEDDVAAITESTTESNPYVEIDLLDPT